MGMETGMVMVMVMEMVTGMVILVVLVMVYTTYLSRRGKVYTAIPNRIGKIEDVERERCFINGFLCFMRENTSEKDGNDNSRQYNQGDGDGDGQSLQRQTAKTSRLTRIR